MLQTDDHPDVLLKQARGRQPGAGRLLVHYRNYLQLIARSLLGHDLHPLVDTSDVVQETFLEAFRDFDQFHGRDEPDLVAWLRSVLAHKLAGMARYHFATRRDLPGTVRSRKNWNDQAV